MIKVLIADDEPLLLRSLKKSIEMMDGEYSVIDTASDGKSALKKAEALNPDVIFTDIRMPIFDGLEFVGKLREKGISAKIVLISGYKEFEYAKKAITLGVEDYLVKPINPLVLQKILQKMKAELQEDIHEKQEAYLKAVIHGGKIEMEDCFFDEKTEICVLYLCFGTYISYRNIQFKINDDSSYNKEIIQILDAQNKKYWILDGKYDAPYNRLMEDAKFLEEYGCTAVVVTCNTAHFFMDMIEHELRIPFISMIRESAKEVASLHPGSVVAVLATDGTVKAGLYQRALEAEDLIPWVPDADIQKEVMYQIYDRIKKGLPCDKASWQKIEDACLEAGCSRVLLACTELSVIKNDEKLSDWYIDPMEILAKRVIEFS